MALSNLNIYYNGDFSANKPDGDDHISALVFLNTTPPGSWSSAAPIKMFRSLAQAEAADIVSADPLYMECWYQIREFFKRSPGGKLYVYLVDEANGVTIDTSYLVPNVEYFYTATKGECRQIGINCANAQIDIQGMSEVEFNNYIVALWENFSKHFFDNGNYAHSPAVSILASPMPQFYDGSFLEPTALTLNDGTFNMPAAAMLIAGSNDGEGKQISNTLGLPCVPALGAAIGVLSKIQVHRHFGIPEESDIADLNTGEYEKIAHAIGATNVEASDLEIAAANQKGYIGLRKHARLSGTFLEDTYTMCSVATTDLNTIEYNRVYGKALRGIRKKLLPKLNSPLYLKGGKLRTGTIENFKALTSEPLNRMLSLGEISEYSVAIDANQDVLTTSTLSIQVVIVPVGVARNIVVTMAFAVKL